jgi:8-oxo-dGTP diphosphatase
MDAPSNHHTAHQVWSFDQWAKHRFDPRPLCAVRVDSTDINGQLRYLSAMRRRRLLKQKHSMSRNSQTRRRTQPIRSSPNHHPHRFLSVNSCGTLTAPMPTTYKNPTPTVDVLIRIDDGLVLIRRSNPPLGWALPGGFVDEGETVEHAAVREAMEETGLEITLESLLYVYSDPARDPRQHTMTVAFTARAQGVPVGQDDAAEARIFSLDSLPSPLVFDHSQIIADYRHFLQTGEFPRPINGQG